MSDDQAREAAKQAAEQMDLRLSGVTILQLVSKLHKRGLETVREIARLEAAAS